VLVTFGVGMILFGVIKSFRPRGPAPGTEGG
jgi:hypothetical protein